MIDTDDLNGGFVFEIVSITQQYPNSFKGLEKMKNYQVKFYSDEKINLWQLNQDQHLITSRLGLLIL